MYRGGIVASLSELLRQGRLVITDALKIEEIKTEIAIDQHKLINQFLQLNNLSIKNILKVNNFVMSGEPPISIDVFVTEDANKLYLEFEIQQLCEDISSENRSDAKILLKGDKRTDSRIIRLNIKQILLMSEYLNIHRKKQLINYKQVELKLIQVNTKILLY